MLDLNHCAFLLRIPESATPLEELKTLTPSNRGRRPLALPAHEVSPGSGAGMGLPPAPAEPRLDRSHAGTRLAQ